MLIGFFTFEVVVFDGSSHILSEGDVAANVVTLEAFTVKFVPSTIHGVVNDSRGSLIIVLNREYHHLHTIFPRPSSHDGHGSHGNHGF